MQGQPRRCLVMGIVNRTEDSFYDGGRMDLDESIAHGIDLVEQGANLLDIGAVKAGPGDDISEEEELERLLPLVDGLKAKVEVPLSIETGRPQVADKALAAGASIVNDVTALADPELASVCAGRSAALVLMHNGGQLRGRPRHPRYADVVSDVLATWNRLADKARSAGVDEGAIVVDPGLDFGKTTFHSLEIMRRLDELVAAEWPVLVAPSRKDVVGETLSVGLEDRLPGTLGLVALAVYKGAAIVRVHDVAPAVHVTRMVEAAEGRVLPAAPLRGLWD